MGFVIRGRSKGPSLERVFWAWPVRGPPRNDESFELAPVEQDAGDDEHRRHRQHMRERSRGRPLGGFLHAILSLDLGVTHRCAVSAHDGQ